MKVKKQIQTHGIYEQFININCFKKSEELMQKQKTYPKFVRLYFKMLLSIDQFCQKFTFLPTLCRLAQTLQVMAYIIMNTFIKINKVQKPIFPESSFDYFDSLFLAQSILLTIALSFVLIVQYKIFNELANLGNHRSIARTTNIIFLFITFYYQFFYLICGFYLLQNLINENFSKTINIGILILAGILQIWQTPFFLSQRLMGNVTIILPILASIISFDFSVYLIFILSILTIYAQSNSQKAFFQVELMFTCFWAILQTNSGNTSFALSLLSLSFIVLFVGGSYLLKYYKSNPITQLQVNMRLLKCYQIQALSDSQKKEKIIYDHLQEQMLYQKYLDQNDNNALSFTTEAKGVDFENWGDLKKQVLWEKIVDSKETNSSFQNMMFYFRAGVCLKKNVLRLIKQMRAYMLKNPNFGLRENYQIYKVCRYASKIYQEKREKDPRNIELSEVIKTQDHYKEFYKLLGQLLDQLISFWRQIVNKNMTVTIESQKCMRNIIKTQKRLILTLSSLSAFNTQKESILAELMSKIINCYQRFNKIQEKSQKETAQIMEFFILSSEQIAKMSLKLQKQLKYNHQDIQSLTIKSLVPFHLDQWIEKKASEFLVSGENQSFVIPFLDSEGYMVLKTCQLYLISQFTSLNFFFKIQSKESPTKLLLLVNIKKQKVECMSQELRNQISMSQDIYNQFISGEITLFFSDLFSIELSEKELSKLTQGNTLKAKIIYGELQRKMSRMKLRRNYEVTLHFEQKIEVDNNSWVILSLYSDWISSRLPNSAQKRSSRLQTSVNDNEDIAERWSQEKFFCKIENPYKLKIIEKLSKRNTISFKSRCVQLSIVNVTTIVLFYMAILLKSATIQNYDFSSSVQSIRNISNQYTYLLHLYSHSYSKALFSNNKTATMQFINSQFFNNTAKQSQLQKSYDSLIQYYTNSKNSDIQTINSIYLPYLNIQSNNVLYNISFGQFQITSSTAYTTLYDFIIQIEKGFTNNTEISFLAKNYPNIVKIMPHYQLILTSTNDFHSQYTTFFYIALSLYIALLVSIIVNLVLAYFMVQTHIEIRGIFTLIQNEDVNTALKMINSLSQQVDNQNGCQQAQLQQKYKLIKTEVYFQSLEDSQFQEKVNQRQQRNTQPKSNNKSSSQSPSLKKLCSYIYFSLFVITMVTIVFVYEWIKITEDQKYFNSIKSLAQKYEVSNMWLQRYYISLFQPAYYSKYFGTTSAEELPIQKIQFFDPYLPDVFKSKLNSVYSLCSEEFGSLVDIPLFKWSYNQCLTVEGGILTKGYSSTLQFYQSWIRKEKSFAFQRYLDANQYQSNKISNIISAKELLQSYLQVNLNIFERNLKQFSDDYAWKEIQALIFIVCSSLIIFGLQVKIIRQLREEKELTLHLIKIVPVEVIEKMKIMSYIRKRQILQKIQTL